MHQRDKPYSGVIIVFVGDFYQLLPIDGKLMYSEYHDLWHSLVKKGVKLQTNHRFGNNLEFGELLDRHMKSEWTEEGIKTINSKSTNDSLGVMTPKEDDI